MSTERTTVAQRQQDDHREPDGGQERENDPGNGRSDGDQGWTTAEKTTFAISVVIILVLAAFAVVEHLREPPGGMPVIEVTVSLDDAERQDEAYLIPFSIANAGAVGASDVTVRFEVIDQEGAIVDEIEVTVAELPVQSVEDGLLMIVADPATHRITARVETFLLP